MWRSIHSNWSPPEKLTSLREIWTHFYRRMGARKKLLKKENKNKHDQSFLLYFNSGCHYKVYVADMTRNQVSGTRITTIQVNLFRDD